VVDYKTGKAPPPGYEEKTLFQMKFYALVLWKARGVVPKRLQLLFLGNGEVLTYDPSEADLLAAERKIAGIWAAIRQAAESRSWEPRPSKLCGWCSFRALCPAQGGVAPAAPEVRIGAAE
jgi:putative RecB family exonuclease